MNRSYLGWDISLAWPTAALRPGACKPNEEKWQAFGPNHNYPVCWQVVYGNTLAEVKRAIANHMQD